MSNWGISMNFEFIYAMGLWLLLWAYEVIALARLEEQRWREE